MCGRVNPDILESVVGVGNLCPVSYRTLNQHDCTTEQSCLHYHTPYGASSEQILLQRSSGCWSENGYLRMRVDRRIRFDYATCGRRDFWIRKKKLGVQEYPDTRGRGTKVI